MACLYDHWRCRGVYVGLCFAVGVVFFGVDIVWLLRQRAFLDKYCERYRLLWRVGYRDYGRAVVLYF